MCAKMNEHMFQINIQEKRQTFFLRDCNYNKRNRIKQMSQSRLRFLKMLELATTTFHLNCADIHLQKKNYKNSYKS